MQKITNAHRRVDWNGNGNNTNNPVAVDLNNSGGNSVLAAGYPEWANIVYDGGNIGASGLSEKRQALTGPNELKELTFEEDQRMERSLTEVK